jgi:hypothetical protein
MAENVPMYAPPPYAPKLEWKHSRKLGDDLAPDIEAATVEAGRYVLLCQGCAIVHVGAGVIAVLQKIAWQRLPPR